jgi:hypothetical protein
MWHKWDSRSGLDRGFLKTFDRTDHREDLGIDGRILK